MSAACLLIVLAASVVKPLPAPPVSPAPAPRIAPSGGQGAQGTLQLLARAYNERSLDLLASLLSADFRFTSTAMETVAAMPKEFGPEHELRTASNLFHGHSVEGRSVMPAADSIAVHIGGLHEADDPEHPDSTAHYRLVAATEVTFDFKVGTMYYRQDPALHVFHLVRGDAAVLAAGQPPDSTRWYLRRWLEDVNALALALARQSGNCDPQPMHPARADEGSPLPQAAPTALAIHALGNPACPAMDLMCDLPLAAPAGIEVYDVMGRRVNRQTVSVGAPGTQRIQAGAGATIRPGVYWVRLSQGRRFTARMIVVAK